MARFLYFSWVREKIGASTEQLPIPTTVTTVSELLEFLRSRGTPYATALANPNLRVAVNQTYARLQDAVTDTDEIAIFPPVSGG
ncbi:MAG: molybdopterin converting factor subunit 1 [Magnetococcales bacterium]|nr:molybdopterin converting factor subunit 1 [Magnetococcales bacterium]